MLLKQLLESPRVSSKLAIYDPFQAPDQGELVKEVIGLANADVEGPRHILFGVNAGAMEGSGIVGIAESAMADLKKAHRLISTLIEPVLQLAFIFDKINGKVVGVLEIDGCDEGPYVVGQNFSEKLSHGRSWIRDGREIRAVEQAELSPVSTPEPEAAKTRSKPAKPPPIEVGFNDELDCQLLEMAVPDTTNPPFAGEKLNVIPPSVSKKTIMDTIGTVTTRILRLGREPNQGAAKADQGGMDAKTDLTKKTKSLLADAHDHYFYEEKALQLNLTVCNKGAEGVKDASIKLGFPRLPGFDVADRLYISPFDKRSPYEIKNMGYPDVERSDDAIVVRSPIGSLAPDSPVKALKCALRLVVGPEMQRRKLAIDYTLRGGDGQNLAKGRLKIKFGKVSA